jgi:5'-hydroxyaverantin dehydrogenase
MIRSSRWRLTTRVQFIQGDVSNWDALLAAFKAAIKFSKHGGIDIVVPSAGVYGGGVYAQEGVTASLDEDPRAPNYKSLDINLKAVASTVTLALHYFTLPPTSPAPKGAKSIVLISSIAAYFEAPSMALYCTAKSGVRGLFKSIRTTVPDLTPAVRVNLVAPTFVNTPMTEPLLPLLQANGTQLASKEDVVKAVLRLAGDESING